MPNLFKSLREKGLWRGYSRHVVALTPVLDRMGERGMPVEPATFEQVVAKLTEDFERHLAKMQTLVPGEIKTIKIYKKVPRKKEGCQQLPDGKWIRPLIWKPSNKGLLAYIKWRKHPVPKDIKTDAETTKEMEIARLSRRTGDQLYATVIQYRKAQTILKNHVKNWHPAADGRVHTTFYLDPATGQLSSRRPNVQNAPKHDDPEFGGYAKVFRSMIKAKPGHMIIECVHPGTRILRHNLTWDKAENIKVGDNLWGFDENLVGNTKRKGRYLRETFVENVSRLRKPCVRVTTNQGTIICAGNHMLLARKRSHYGQDWRAADSLRPGDRIAHFIQPWNTETSWSAGWLAGILDGEGYGGRKGHRGLSFGQNLGVVAEQAVLHAKEFGFNFELYETNRKCKYFSLRNPEAFAWLRAIGTLRPFRLYLKALQDMEGMAYWGKNSAPAIVISIEDVGEQEVIAIETSTHTYCAEGLVSHNCDYKAFHVQTLGFEAQDADMMRMGRLDIHSFTTAAFLHLNTPERMVEMPDDELKAYLGWVKKNHKYTRDAQCKHALLGYNNGMGYRKLYLQYIEFFKDMAEAKRVMELLDALFPKSAAYREAICQKAHDQGYLISRHGYIRYFWEVFKWKAGKWSHGDDHEAALCFFTQNDAHGELKDRILTLAERGLDERYGLLNCIHDSLVFECPLALQDECVYTVKTIMEAPSVVLIDPIVAPHGLAVEVDVQGGPDWSAMKGLA